MVVDSFANSSTATVNVLRQAAAVSPTTPQAKSVGCSTTAAPSCRRWCCRPPSPRLVLAERLVSSQALVPWLIRPSASKQPEHEHQEDCADEGDDHRPAIPENGACHPKERKIHPPMKAPQSR
jgi:hypothetical protein